MWAGDPELVRVLLLSGCNPHASDPYGDTPTTLAHELHDKAMLSLLRAEDKNHITVTDLAMDVESTGCERTGVRDEPESLFAVRGMQNALFPKGAKRALGSASAIVQPATHPRKP